MSASTINITLPPRLKEEIENRVRGGMYTSVSEFIRMAVRSALVTQTDLPYGESFSKDAEKQILKTEAESLKNLNKTTPIVTNPDIDKFFEKL